MIVLNDEISIFSLRNRFRDVLMNASNHMFFF